MNMNKLCINSFDSAYSKSIENVKSIQSPVFNARSYFPCPKLEPRHFFAIKSLSNDDFSTIYKDSKSDIEEAVLPVYVPTPPHRHLRTPHSGYHFDGSKRKFFEGWYFKVSIPERRQNFCFMYSIENPSFQRKMNKLEEEQYGPRSTGVGAQILGADDKYICQYTEESHQFWGSSEDLMLGNTFMTNLDMQPPNKGDSSSGVQGKSTGRFPSYPILASRTDYVETVKTARWEYCTRPIYGWGDVVSKQRSTAGWLAAFPVFEPHWQICMAHGLSTGWIEWDGERYEFQNAPSYSEKNWGGAFPRKWFWIQCNVFEGISEEVSLTCGGGLRQLPGLSENYENAALIAIHHEGTFYEFVPWNGVISWEISTWGHWLLFAENKIHKPILDITSNMAAVEVGGGPWFNTWKGKTFMPEIINHALNIPVDIEGIFGLVPFLKPPGL